MTQQKEQIADAFEVFGIDRIDEETLPLLNRIIEETREWGNFAVDIAQQRALQDIRLLQTLYVVLSETDLETNEILGQSKEIVGGFLQDIDMMPAEE